jgi:hypothetical protein
MTDLERWPEGKHDARYARRKWRRGRFAGIYLRAECPCGWAGPSRPKTWEVRLDARAHNAQWGSQPDSSAAPIVAGSSARARGGPVGPEAPCEAG